jgi:diguanylate cyclase (GGDEF)-like protein
MSQLVDHLAELTGFRDRDVLDVTLVGALRDLLRPQEVAIYRAVGEPGSQFWMTRARLRADDTAPHADPLWAEPGSLPPLDSAPQRLACLHCQHAVQHHGEWACAWFPVANDQYSVQVLELHTERPLDAEALRTVSSVLRIYRNFQDLLDYSERDTLTGLLNRKTFDERFMRMASVGQEPAAAPPATPAPGVPELRRLAPAGRMWLAVIDIDHFKRVNDVYGHLIGDEVLLLLSRLMRSTFRFHDHLYRFGGEEFVVLMRCDDVEAATSALQRLRQVVAGYRFPQVERITVSVGFTALRASDTPSGAFERADLALYHIKQNGRDGVACHAELVAQGHLQDRERDNDVELF